MFVKLNIPLLVDSRNYAAGSVVELAADRAKAFLASGVAKLDAGPASEPAPPVETASLKPGGGKVKP